MAEHAGTIVGYTVIHENPIPVGRDGSHLPALQRYSILRCDREILFARACACQHLLRVLKTHGIEAHGMKDSAADRIADKGGEEWRNR